MNKVYEFARTIALECAEGACLFAESHMFSQETQNQYLSRPTQKDVFVTVKATHIETPTLQQVSFDSASSRIYMIDQTSRLHTQDFCASKALPSVNLGARVPFKNSFIVDSLFDTFNGRLFILQSNWQLQVWSLSQRSDRPLRAVSIRNGHPPAKESKKHLFSSTNFSYLIVISPAGSHILVVHAVSLHIASTIELTSCIVYYIENLEQVTHQAVRFIVTEIVRRYPISETLSKNEYEDVINKRTRELDFNQVFRGQVKHFGNRDEAVSVDVISDFICERSGTMDELDREDIHAFFQGLASDGLVNREHYEKVLKEGALGMLKAQQKSKKKNYKNFIDLYSINVDVKEVCNILQQVIESQQINSRQIFSQFDDEKLEKIKIEKVSQLIDHLLPLLNEQKKQAFLKAIEEHYYGYLSYNDFQKILTPTQPTHLSFKDIQEMCLKNGIDLQKNLEEVDIHKTDLLDRFQFQMVLRLLPFGILDDELNYITEKQVPYDSESGKVKYRKLFQDETSENKQNISYIAYIEDTDVVVYTVEGTANVFASKVNKSISDGTETLLAVLRGNQQPLPPIVYYCMHSGCVITCDRVRDPLQTSSFYIWKLYQDLSMKYDVNPPWQVRPALRVECCTGSITSVVYLPQSQLIVTAGQDGQIRFWDPVSLTLPTNKQVVRIKPGYYKETDLDGYGEYNANFQQVKSVNSLAFQLEVGSIHTSFRVDNHQETQVLSVELLILGGESSVNVWVVHRQPLEIAHSQYDLNVPKGVIIQIEESLKSILEEAIKGKRAGGQIGVEKEINREVIRRQISKELVKISKQMIFAQLKNQELNIQTLQKKIIQDIKASSQMENSESLNAAYIYQLLKQASLVNPSNTPYTEYKQVLTGKTDEAVVREHVKAKNLIDEKIKQAIHDGKLNFRMEFEKFGAVNLGGVLAQDRPRFKRLLLRNQLYTNENDFSNLLQLIYNDRDQVFIGIQQLDEYYKNEYLVRKLRVVARPDQIVQEIKKILSDKELNRQFINSLAYADKNGDGLLTLQEYKVALKTLPEPVTSIFIEFFNLYANNINDQQVIRVSLIMQKALSIEENLYFKRITRVIAKIRNTIIYRGLDLDFLFKSSDEVAIPQVKRNDFIDRCEKLNTPGVTLQDLRQLADFLSVREGKELVVPYKSFEHYANRLHASESFILIDDAEQLHTIALKVLENREQLRELFSDHAQSFQDYRIWLHRIGLIFEEADKLIIGVVGTGVIKFEEFLDRIVNFLKGFKEGFNHLTFLADKIKELSTVNITKLYEQCVQFDNEAIGSIELTVFANIVAYNIGELLEGDLVDFQKQWTELSRSSLIDYRRYFKEYVGFYYSRDAEKPKSIQLSQSSIVNQLMLKFAKQVEQASINLSFTLKKFYDHNGTSRCSNHQIRQLFYQVDFKLKGYEEDDLFEFLGLAPQNDFTCSHQQFYECYILAKQEIQVAFEYDVWQLAGQNLNISSLQKLQRNLPFLMTSFQALSRTESLKSKIVLPALSLNSLRKAFDDQIYSLVEIQNFCNFAAVGSRITLEEAMALIKAIRRSEADLTKHVINVDYFAKAVPLLLKDKLSQRATKASEAIQANISIQESIIEYHLQDENLTSIRAKVSDGLKKLNACFLQIAFSQRISVNRKGFIQNQEFRRLIKSLPCQLTMLEKHKLYNKFNMEQVSLVEVSQILEEFPKNASACMNIIMEKLYTALLWSGFSLKDLFEQADVGRNREVTENEMIRAMSIILSELESITLLDSLINQPKFDCITFIKAFQSQGYQPLQINLINVLQTLSYHDKDNGGQLFQCLEEFQSHNQKSKVSDMPIKSILDLFQRVGIKISLTGMRILIRNFLLKKDPAFNGCPEAVRALQFIQWLPEMIYENCQRINDGNELLREIKKAADAQGLSLFEVYALCDTSQDGQITKEELTTGVMIVKNQFDISLLWDQFEKNQFDRVSFTAYYRRFVEASCIQEKILQDCDQSILKRFAELSHKVGDAPQLFKKLDTDGDGLVTYGEFLAGSKKLKLGLEENEIQQLYIMIVGRRDLLEENLEVNQENQLELKLRGVTFKELVHLIQSDRQPHLVHKAFECLTTMFKQYRDRTHKDWSQVFKDFLLQKRKETSKQQPGNSPNNSPSKVPLSSTIRINELSDLINFLKFQISPEDVMVIVNSFDEELISPIQLEQRLHEYAQPAQVKTTMQTETLQKLLKDLIISLRGEIPKIHQVYKEQGGKNPDNIKFSEFYNLIVFCQLKSPKEHIRMMFKTIDNENKNYIRLVDLEYILQKEQIRLRSKQDGESQLKFQRRQEVMDLIGSQLRAQKKGSIEDILKASKIHLNEILTRTQVQEFLNNQNVFLSEEQVEALIEVVQARIRANIPTFGDLIVVLIQEHCDPSSDLEEAQNRAAKAFMFGCLEFLGHILKRMALPPQIALRYFLKNNSISVQDFQLCMISLNYDAQKLRHGTQLIERFFQIQGGRNLTELQMIILIDQAIQEVVMQGHLKQEGMNDIVLEVLVNIYRSTYIHQISHEQLISYFKTNNSQFINKEELTDTILKLDSTITMKQIGELIKYLDQHQQGQISVTQLVQSVYLASGVVASAPAAQNALTRSIIARIKKAYYNYKNLLERLCSLEFPIDETLLLRNCIKVEDFIITIEQAMLTPSEKTHLKRSLSVTSNTLDLEILYEMIESAQLYIEEEEEKISENLLERSVIIKNINATNDKLTPTANNIHQVQLQVMQAIFEVLNINQVSLWQGLFEQSNRQSGILTDEQFQNVLKKLNINLQLEDVNTLICLLDKKSDGKFIHFTELQACMKQNGYKVPDPTQEIQIISLYNLLLLEMAQLDHLKQIRFEHKSDIITTQEFLTIITNDGECAPFTDSQVQRLTNLFALPDGTISFKRFKSMIEKLQDTLAREGDLLEREREEEDQIQQKDLPNIFARLNGFQLSLNIMRCLKEIWNNQIDYVRELKDSGMPQLSLQLSVQRLNKKINQIWQFFQMDIQLINAASYNILNHHFASTVTQPIYIQEKSMVSLLKGLSGSIIFTQIPESQYIPHTHPNLEKQPHSWESEGKISATSQGARVVGWSIQALILSCYDGQSLKFHLLDELKLHTIIERNLMNSTSQQSSQYLSRANSSQIEQQPLQVPQQGKILMPFIGIIEKKTNLGTEIHAVYHIEQQYTRFSEVLITMGGLIKVPALVLSGQLTLVSKLWANQILNALIEIENFGYAHPMLRPENIWVNSECGQIVIGDLNGVQQLNQSGKCGGGIDVKYLVEDIYYSNLSEMAIAPEFGSKRIEEVTQSVNTWVFGVFLFEMLFGTRPNIIHLKESKVEQKNEYIYQEKLNEPSIFNAGNLLQHEIFTNMIYHLSDLIDTSTMNTVQQVKTQLEQKSLGALIKELFNKQDNIEIDTKQLDQLGSIVDLMCLCLQFHPHSRPTLNSIERSGILKLTKQETIMAVKIAKPLINYQNPRLVYHEQIYLPCRRIAKLCILKDSTFLDSYNDIVDIIGKFRHTLSQSLVEGGSSKHVTKTKSGLASQKLDLIQYLFHTKILDMLVFLTLHFQNAATRKADKSKIEKSELLNKQVIQLHYELSKIFTDLIHHLSNSSNPASLHVDSILNALVKLTLGEPYQLTSDQILGKPKPGFFSTSFRDEVDEIWDKFGLTFTIEPYSFWTPLVYKTAAPIYKDMVSESGLGSGSAIAVRQFIQVQTEKELSPFQLTQFTLGSRNIQSQNIGHFNPTRSVEYYNEVISVSDAQLQISHFLQKSNMSSTVSLKIAINYLLSLAQSKKTSKLMLLADSKIIILLAPLLCDNDYQVRNLVLSVLKLFSQSFVFGLNEIKLQEKIQPPSAQALIQQYQQNDSATLLKNLGVITHLVNHRKKKIENQRFLSFTINRTKSEETPQIMLSLSMAQSTFSLSSIYAAFTRIIVDQNENLLNKTEVYLIMANVLQWKNASTYLNTGVCTLLTEIFRPFTYRKDTNKPNQLLKCTSDLFTGIVTQCLPSTLQLINENYGLRNLFKLHGYNIPQVQTPESLQLMFNEKLDEWLKNREALTQEIRDIVALTSYLNRVNKQFHQLRKTIKDQHTEFFNSLFGAFDQTLAFVRCTELEFLLEKSLNHAFTASAIGLIETIFYDLSNLGQCSLTVRDVLNGCSQFILGLCSVSPLLVFNIEEIKLTSNFMRFLMNTIDSIYEYHVEWDRVNQDRIQREKVFLEALQEEQQKTSQFLSKVQQSHAQTHKSVTFQDIPTSNSQVFEKGAITKSQVNQKIDKSSVSQKLEKSTISMQKSTLPSIPEPNKPVTQSTLPLELRPYSSNNLIHTALNMLRILVRVLNSQVPQYTEIFETLNVGEWWSQIVFKQWVVFERVISQSLEDSLIIKNQADESMVRTSFFEAIVCSRSKILQQQIIDGGILQGIFLHLLQNFKCFELKKILKTGSYLPFIHWLPYRHEALTYLTCIIWEKEKCIDLYNEMMIQIHQKSILVQESSNLQGTIENKSHTQNFSIMFSRLYLGCLFLSTEDSSLNFLMKQLKFNQKIMAILQSNEDLKVLFQGIYQKLVAEELALF